MSTNTGLDGRLYGNRILEFMLGGDAEFYLYNSATGNRLYYSVTKAYAKKGDVDERYFVKGKMTRANQYYSYCGTVIKASSGFKYYPATGEKANIYLDTAWFMKSIRYVIERVLTDSLPDVISFVHMGRCGLCHRRLTDAHSVELGFGSSCYKKLQRMGLSFESIESLK